MTKRKFFIIGCVLFAFSLSAISVDELLDKFAETLAVPTISGTFKVKLISKNNDVREIEARVYQKQTGRVQNNRLFVFDFPPTVRGTALLLHSYFDGRPNNMWIYLPAVRRVKRIALESSGGGYFMGSDFTYRDLINNDVSDLDFELLSDASPQGVDCYVLKAWGRTPELSQDFGYSHTISYHRKDNYMLWKREYYDFNGDLLKVYQAYEYLVLGTAIYPTDIRMENVQTGHQSVITVEDASTDDIPDRYFTQRYLINN